MNPKTIAIASDHAGFELKELLKNTLLQQGYAVDDLGAHGTQSVDYPDYAHALAGIIEKTPHAKGVLICGSGIGMSIAANRHKGVRAALCQTAEAAKLSRQHNDANVLCLGARLVSAEVAKDALAQFLSTGFEGGRHAARIAKL